MFIGNWVNNYVTSIGVPDFLPNLFVYTGITVRDLDRAVKFYTEVMGMKLVSRIENPFTNGEFAVVESNETSRLELNWYRDKKDYVNGDELDHLAFLVEDARKELKRLRALGVEIVKEPYESSNHVVFFVKDPDGIWLEIFSKKNKDAYPLGVNASN
jgi:lactoylglutathione lyase